MYKCGLVLEGGGMRANYENGVLDAFIKADIAFPYVIGTSAGSCNGCSFIARNFQRNKKINIDHVGDKNYIGFGSLLKTGEFLNTKYLFNDLSYDILPLDHDAFEASNSILCATATNARTGKAEYFYPKSFRNGCPELAASCAMPLVCKPVNINGEYYYDGGVTDSIPLKKALEDGCEKAVVILTQHREFVKKKMDNPVLKLGLHKFPKTYEALTKRYIMYNNQKKFVFEQEKAGNAFVICPPVELGVSSMEKNVDTLNKIYNIGYEQGEKIAADVLHFINS